MAKRKPKRKRARRVVAVSDLHVGSHTGLTLPTVQLANGGTYTANAAQQGLYEAWADFCCRWKRPDVLLFLGDGPDGRQAKDFGVTSWSTDFRLQATTCAKLLNMWQARSVYMVFGTKYHVDPGGLLIEEWMGDLVDNARRDRRGRYAPAHRYVQVGGKLFHLGHYIGGSRVWQYRATPKSREMALNLIAAAVKEAHRADVILRGHVHHYLMVDAAHQRGLTCPCWQLQTDREGSRNPFGWVPQIGAVRFTIREDDIDIEREIVDFSSELPQPEEAP